MQHIVKRAGKEEKFDERKIYASVYAALMAIRINHKEAELISKEVCSDLGRWIKDKGKVSSNQIFREATRSLKLYNRDAAYLYEHHRDIS